MAVFKCKMCGGEIQPNVDGFTGACLYCGTTQTLPKDTDEKVSQLLNRANDFRLNSDFDRAIFEYEKILAIDESEPEAHWGIFLSKYGVEYVKDTMTQMYKPTLHRISSVSVYDDVEYQATLKYASLGAIEQYKTDAEHIELVMKELLILSANQEPYDIFLSYKELDDVTRKRTDDSYLAHDLYNELTAQGYKVFFAPKSLGVGLYEPKIYAAIISSKVMIVLGTKTEYLEGVWVKNEWSRFVELIEKGEDKVLIPVFKNMEAGQMPNRIAKYQAYDMSSMTFLPSLLEAIAKSVNKESQVNFDKNTSKEAVFVERGFLALEDRDFRQAASFFEQALNSNPHSSRAYLGRLMVEMGVSKKEEILSAPQPLKNYINFEKALRFADQKMKTVLLQYEENVQRKLDMREFKKARELICKSNPTVKDFQDALEIFESINTLADAKIQRDYCVDVLEGLRKDEILQGGYAKEKTGAYQEAIQLYKKIPGWRDADNRLSVCTNCIKDIAEAQEARRLEEIRLAEEQKADKKLVDEFNNKLLKYFVIGVIGALLVMFIVIYCLPRSEEGVFVDSFVSFIFCGIMAGPSTVLTIIQMSLTTSNKFYKKSKDFDIVSKFLPIVATVFCCLVLLASLSTTEERTDTNILMEVSLAFSAIINAGSFIVSLWKKKYKSYSSR